MRQKETSQSKLQIEQLYSSLEKLVVEGNHGECRKLLEETSPRQIPRDWATRFGEISFRVHLPSFTLKVLHRFVYPENSFQDPATDHEKTVYASALYTFGAIDEALQILESVSSEENPEVWFHKAGANFCAWNYEAGIPFFKKYIQSEKLTDYKRLVGKVNLAAAFIFTCDWSPANALLEEAKRHCERHQYRLLLGNCFELLAQIEIFQGRYDAAIGLLKNAMTCLKDQGGFYELYAEKWMLIARCLKSSAPEDLKSLHLLRDKAFALGHWNTVRECDLFEGLISRNGELIRKVVMGTPYEPYRRRVRKLFGAKVIAKGQFQLSLPSARMEKFESWDQDTTVFDPCQKGAAPEALYEKPLLFSLYNALTDDFYHPSSLGSLFQKIYPTEKFNPYTSPARVLQLLRRLDNWFSDNGHLIQVSFKKSEFRLVSEKNVSVMVQRGAVLTANEGKIVELKNHFSTRRFSTSEVCEVLGISKSSANRLLKEALEDGKLRRDVGRLGRPYCFAQSNAKRRAA